ncbi:MAG: histidine phosphatase family protein [Thermoplasmata archaeon]|nr:histidine phosphatase family protein [Thermoplasmata archaeon]
MEVFLFRHGPAETRDPARWPDDEDRPLSRGGARETRRAARGFARVVGPVDRIATSPALRASKSAAALEKAFAGEHVSEVWPELASGTLAAPLLDRLRNQGRRSPRIVLVGHEPTLGEFIGLALTGEAISLQRLSKAGGASLEFRRAVRPSAGRLQWLLTRKQLIGLAP